MKQIYIENLQEEYEADKNFGFIYDGSIPSETYIRIQYKGREMISVPVYGTDERALHAICGAISRAYLEGETYGRFIECACL